MLIKTWNEKQIRWREDGFGCLTDMGKATNKNVSDWLRLKGTKEYMDVLSTVTEIPATQLLQVIQGGEPEKQGTWASRQICIRFAQWCSPEFAVQVDLWVEEIMTAGYVDLREPEPVVPLLEPVTDETIRTYTDSIRYFEGNDDIQLAQLIKVTFGNRLLQQQQNAQNQQAEVEQYEGAVDVAIRLGFRVPSNYEGSLGNHVRKTCENFIVGKNKRYSAASAKQVSANMYPAYHPEVEDAVMDYCVKKAFRNNNTRLIA